MIEKVSVHGGHSGQFCQHAKDSLEDVVQAYIAAGFSWAGITEHMPPPSDQYRYPDEVAGDLTANFLRQRFTGYFTECRQLQEKYADKITLYSAFETEWTPGSLELINELIATVQPDYIVGSVHHVDGIGIDVNKELYEQAIKEAGNKILLYCKYFDAQYELLQALRPAVVGHFDLIRIFDDTFQATLAESEVQSRISRNLEYIAEQNLIIDFNLRGYDKTAQQYPCNSILQQANELGIAIVPGDDSHGVSSVGRNYEKGVQLLQKLGISTQWQRPRLYNQ